MHSASPRKIAQVLPAISRDGTVSLPPAPIEYGPRKSSKELAQLSPATVNAAVRAKIPVDVLQTFGLCARYDDDFNQIGYSRLPFTPEQAAPILAMLEDACAPAPSKMITDEILRLRVTTKHRTERDMDELIVQKSYHDGLKPWPADAVMAALKEGHRLDKGWFPDLYVFEEFIKPKCLTRVTMRDALRDICHAGAALAWATETKGAFQAPA